MNSGFFSNLRENIKNSLWWFRLGLRSLSCYTIRNIRLVFKVYIFPLNDDIENLTVIRIITIYSFNNYFLDAYYVLSSSLGSEHTDARDSCVHNFHFLQQRVRILCYFRNLRFLFSCPVQEIFPSSHASFYFSLYWSGNTSLIFPLHSSFETYI